MSSKKSKRDILQAPRGTRDLVGDHYDRIEEFFERASSIARYYGFSAIETPIFEHQEIFLKGLDVEDDAVKEMYSLSTKSGDKLALRPEGTAPIMRAYIEHGMGSLPQPVFLYYKGPFFRHEKPQKGRYRQFYQFGLEIIGANKAVLDAIAIQTGYQILKECGLDVTIKINTLGDVDNRKDYLKELKKYYQKNKKKLGKADQARLTSNPLRILDSKHPDTIEVNKEAPSLLSSMNTATKKHFKKVLECLDGAHVPYELDHTLVRGLDYYGHTVFEYVLVDEEGNTSLALGGGGRYDGLAKTLGYNREAPGVGLGLGVDRIIEQCGESCALAQVKKKPKFYFIQLGFEARSHALAVIEILRKKKITIKHSLSKDRLSVQLGMAESLGIPYALIYGQKEALDGTIIVRNMKTRKQETVAVEKLTDYLKKLK